MTLKEKAERKAAEITIDQLLKYIDKNPQQNLLKLLDLAEKLLGGIFPQKMLNSVRREIEKGDGVYYNYAMNVLKDVDRGVIKSMLLGFGLGVVHGTKRVRENREKYGCNVPFTILMDPTSACNCRCKGCWSAEYGHKDSLTFDEMAGVISEGKELGAHMFMFTGGEPLLRKDDLIRLCEQNPDCAFLVYTNGTLVDEKFCDELLRVGNMALALSIEGTEETTDARRGEGLYQKVLKAMSLLKSKGCLFGMSVCYTRENMDQVTSDEFMNKMLDCGVKFGLYFNFMPIGHSAPVELIPTPEQREYMYKWLRKTRNGETGKPMFVMDFQDDGEYVGGCIAGGRNYIHINAAGDIEPCVFIHFSDSNIRTHTILQALQNPLFMAFRHDQPFNDNHLRPCPMLENPQCLRDIIKRTGAKSTNLMGEETAEQICSKCDKFAAEWAPRADEIWRNNPHPSPKTQYYRDTPEGKAEFAAKEQKAE